MRPALAETGTAPQPARVFDLRIGKRRLAGGPSTIRVHQGEFVELRWTTDEATTLHLHGYDLKLPVTPGTPAVMRFDARATGRFPVAAHGFGVANRDSGEQGTHRETTILYLEVHPR